MTQLNFGSLSKQITAAADTGNKEVLHHLSEACVACLSYGFISIQENQELQADIEQALDNLAGNDYLDEVFAAARLESVE